MAGTLASTLTFVNGGSISSLFNTGATIQVESTLTNNSLFVNQGTIVLNAGTYQSSANFTNALNEFVIASDDSTLSAASVVNRGTILTTNATLLVSNLVVQAGTVTIGNGGTLMLVGPGALTNFGTINLVGTSGNNAVLNLGTAALTNLSGGTITGGGIIQNASQVVNLLGGTFLATSTVVELQFTNANTVGNAGTIGAATGATLTFGAAGAAARSSPTSARSILPADTQQRQHHQPRQRLRRRHGHDHQQPHQRRHHDGHQWNPDARQRAGEHGTAIVANASALNVLTDWTNGGVLTNAATGAVSGGNPPIMAQSTVPVSTIRRSSTRTA